MNHLLRDLAPLSDTAWAAIDAEATERLKPQLAARRLADFHGPYGWQHDASGLGRFATLSGPPAGVVRADTVTRQVIAPDAYVRIVETTKHGGYPLMDHLRRVLGGGSVVRSPGVDGAVVLSLRGGDFRFEVGQDLSVGYDRHDETTVTFYLEESFAFRVLEPDAAITLTR